jgi:hypothetical protein
MADAGDKRVLRDRSGVPASAALQVQNDPTLGHARTLGELTVSRRARTRPRRRASSGERLPVSWPAAPARKRGRQARSNTWFPRRGDVRLKDPFSPRVCSPSPARQSAAAAGGGQGSGQASITLADFSFAGAGRPWPAGAVGRCCLWATASSTSAPPSRHLLPMCYPKSPAYQMVIHTAL